MSAHDMRISTCMRVWTRVLWVAMALKERIEGRKADLKVGGICFHNQGIRWGPNAARRIEVTKSL